MSKKGGRKHKLVKDYTGEVLKLTLILKQEFKKKDYDLYTICKVKKDENDEDVYIPLYDETFTDEQYDDFFNKPTYYLSSLPE